MVNEKNVIGGHAGMNFVVESERLLLRQFDLADVEEYYQMTRDPLIQHYVSHACETSIEETYEAFEICYSVQNNPYDFYLVLVDKKTQKIVGAIISTAIKTSPLILDVGILTGAEYRKQGYMFEALLAFKDALPEGTELLFAIRKENLASIKTVTKLPGIVEKPLAGQKEFLQYSLTI